MYYILRCSPTHSPWASPMSGRISQVQEVKPIIHPRLDVHCNVVSPMFNHKDNPVVANSLNDREVCFCRYWHDLHVDAISYDPKWFCVQTLLCGGLKLCAFAFISMWWKLLHQKLTLQWKFTIFNRKFIFNWFSVSIFVHCDVRFRGCFWVCGSCFIGRKEAMRISMLPWLTFVGTSWLFLYCLAAQKWHHGKWERRPWDLEGVGDCGQKM